MKKDKKQPQDEAVVPMVISINTTQTSNSSQPIGLDAAVYLDQTDPFERVLVDMVRTNRKKRADYATDGEVFSNFRITSEFAGFDEVWMSALFNCQQKLARIQALRANGRTNETANESVADTLLDLAVYSVIALAIYQSPEVK